MKTFLLSTDFSVGATHATNYGYHLAKLMKANVLLCNAVVVPAEMPQAGVVVWPMEECDVLMEDSSKELKRTKSHLEHLYHEIDFKPGIDCLNEESTVVDMINNVISRNNIDMVIMGTHGNKGLSSFLLSNHSKRMIEVTTKPLLLIPPTSRIKAIKKIAFATDFTNPKQDLGTIYELISLARPLNAEILIIHIYDDKYHFSEFQEWINEFKTELSNKADYPHIYYREIKRAHTVTGLDWLCEYGQIDVLAMVHRPHSFFENILKGSHTQKMANHINIPLLIFSGKS